MIQRSLSRITGFIQQKPLPLLLCLWLCMQALLLFVFGIVSTGEATKYSEEASNLLNNGSFSEQKYIFYSAYILLHVIFRELGFETVGVYVFQLLLNLISMYCLFRLVYQLSKSKVVSFVCVCLMIACYSWQLWAIHLYTESLFCPLIIIFSYSLFALQKGYKQKNLAVFLFLLILFTRPTGLLFIPVMGCLEMYKLYKKKKIAVVIYGLIVVSVFLVVLNFAMKSGTSYDFIKPLTQNYVICDVPLPEETTNNTLYLQDAASDLPGLFNYIIQNPGSFLKMAGLKFISYWGLTREYYSQWHNIAFACFFYPLYFFGVFGITRFWKINKLFTIYGVGIMLIFTMSVMFTCDDWNNRFIMPILPFVMLFASFGMRYLYEKVIEGKTKNGFSDRSL